MLPVLVAVVVPGAVTGVMRVVNAPSDDVVAVLEASTDVAAKWYRVLGKSPKSETE
jgi:hypothetical protein